MIEEMPSEEVSEDESESLDFNEKTTRSQKKIRLTMLMANAKKFEAERLSSKGSESQRSSRKPSIESDVHPSLNRTSDSEASNRESITKGMDIVKEDEDENLEGATASPFQFDKQ